MACRRYSTSRVFSAGQSMACEQPPWLQHLACEPEATRGAPPRMRRLFGVDLFLSLSFWPVSGRFGAPGACPAASGLRVLPGVPWEGTRRATQRHDGTRINLREACRSSVTRSVLYSLYVLYLLYVGF